MGKTRMTAVDLRAAASELSHKLVGMRLQNIYDINPRTYLLKFGGAGRDEKEYVLLEVGARLHSTTFAYDKPKVPSGFTLKLRKHIRQWRLDSLRQLGVDRVVDFCFGSEDRAYHLLVEFYAKGNLILTDHEYTILALVRTFNSEDARYAVRARYPLQEVQKYRAFSAERLEACIQACETDEGGQSLKQHITNVTDYGPAFVEHCILCAGLKPNAKKAAAAAAARASAEQLLAAFAQADTFLREVPPQQGFLVRRRPPGSASAAPAAGAGGAAPAPAAGAAPAAGVANGVPPAAAAAAGSAPAQSEAAAAAAPAAREGDSSDDEQAGGRKQPAASQKPPDPYDDFAPVLFRQHQKPDIELAEFPSFNAACDVYFSAQDQAQIEKHNVQSEKVKDTKVDKAKRDHQRRLTELERAQATNERYARLIQYNIDDVEQALAIVRGAVAQGVSWEELARLIKEQRRAGHPIAAMIHQLHLDRNRVALLLSPEGGGSDSEEEGPVDDSLPAEVVEVDIALSAHANARMYFDTRRKAVHKQQRTEAAAGKAMKQAARKAEKDAKRQENAPKREITLMRKQLWFEKFHWFVTSDNMLCIAGRDAQQNELLVRRYLRRGDLYVHADMHGAATCILKNPAGRSVPLSSLCEAGTMTVCRSNAWDAHIVIGAWWVHHHQVSKTAPTGEYLPTGSFMVRGKKNYLPPSKLHMGLGVLFRVHEEHIHRHRGERGGAPDADQAAGGGEGSAPASGIDPAEPAAEDAAEPDAPASPALSAAAPSTAAASVRPSGAVLQRYGLQSDAYAGAGGVARPSHADPADPVEPAAPAVRAEPRQATEAGPKGKKGISRKERRLLRKQRAAGGAPPAAGDSDGSSSSGQEEGATSVAGTQQGGQQLTRGERRKRKKLQRYKDQSDDERQMKMQLCGHFGGQKALIETAEKQAAQRQRQQGGQGEDDEVAPGASTAALADFGEDEAFAKDEHTKGLPRAEREVQLDTDVLDALTALPCEDDLLLHAMVVCGPWAAVEDYKYRVGVFPGKEKKGKASNAALYSFGKNADTDQEREVIRRMDVQELITALPSNIRIEGCEAAAPGGAKTGKGASGGAPAAGAKKKGGKKK